MRLWRYLVPNAITATSLAFAILSIMNAVGGRILLSAWFALYCVLTDKLDGAAARLLGGSSAFGVQFDSFADFASFGLAPATLFYTYLSRTPALGLAQGPLHLALAVATVVYVLCVAFRLARFNVAAPVGGTQIYFGAPTTLMGGTLLSLFVALLKYGNPAATGIAAGGFGGPRALGALAVPTALWHAWPLVLVAGGALMVGSLRVPKLGLTKNRPVNVFIILNIAGVYGFGILQWLPEYLAAIGLGWMLMSVVFGHFAPQAREARRPPLFGPPGEEPGTGAAAKAPTRRTVSSSHDR